MRIPQKRLIGIKPQYIYNKNGATVQLYLEPIYCINIIHGKDKQCYPLTQQQYFDYCKEADAAFDARVTLKYWLDKLETVKELKAKHPDMIVYDRLIQYYMDKMMEVKI